MLRGASEREQSGAVPSSDRSLVVISIVRRKWVAIKLTLLLRWSQCNGMWLHGFFVSDHTFPPRDGCGRCRGGLEWSFFQTFTSYEVELVERESCWNATGRYLRTMCTCMRLSLLMKLIRRHIVNCVPQQTTLLRGKVGENVVAEVSTL